MSQYLLEPETRKRQHYPEPGRRHHQEQEHQLVLTELNPDQVIDHLEPEESSIDLITFGTVRETCPKCVQPQLKLVLRQRRVRLAHLFCADCLSCFDAHYGNGTSALTI